MSAWLVLHSHDFCEEQLWVGDKVSELFLLDVRAAARLRAQWWSADSQPGGGADL